MMARMCGIPCLTSRWTPALFPEYRAPKRNGWTIANLPEEIPDELRRAWTLRRLRNNRNGHDAVEEALIFLHNNHVELTNEIRSLMENQADFEWCGFEPNRCRHRAKANAAGVQRAPVEVKMKVHASAPAVPAVQRVPRQPSKPKCCGG